MRQKNQCVNAPFVKVPGLSGRLAVTLLAVTGTWIIHAGGRRDSFGFDCSPLHASRLDSMGEDMVRDGCPHSHQTPGKQRFIPFYLTKRASYFSWLRMIWHLEHLGSFNPWPCCLVVLSVTVIHFTHEIYCAQSISTFCFNEAAWFVVKND